MKRLRTRRKRERWVSKSKELHGASINDPGRNPNFDYDETKLLISLWGDPFFQKTLITTHRKQKVIVQLAEQMKEFGYNRTPGEINTRIKNLKCFYNRLKRDIDAGVVEEISWKHFKSMDEIMNRSVFSVRPNEIPKPSRRYQLEMAKMEVEGTQKQKASILQTNVINSHLDFSNISLKNEALSDEDEVQVINSENNSDFHDSDGVIMTEKEGLIHLQNNKAREEKLLSPKAVASNQKDKNPENQTPILNDNAQVSNSSSSPGSQVPNPNKIVHTNPTQLKTLKTPTAVPQSIVFTNPPANGVSSQGKISLVPTNFLLQQNNKPQPQQIQIRPQTQQRIICAQPNNQTNTGIVSSAANGRMKVLFVNAFQNGNASNVSANKEFPLNNPNLMSNTNVHPTEPTTSINYMDHTKTPRVEDAEVNKDYGFELLFNKLIEMQNENNEIQRQQLELARQRLEFEKSIANKFLEALISLKPTNTLESTNISNLRKRNANSNELNNEKSIIPDIIDDFNNYHLLTPKLEKID